METADGRKWKLFYGMSSSTAMHKHQVGKLRQNNIESYLKTARIRRKFKCKRYSFQIPSDPKPLMDIMRS